MREVITFMELTKEVSFIFGINIPNPTVFCKVFEDNQSCISVTESNKSSPIKNKSPLSIIISEDLYKIRLFRYVILIHKNKSKKF